MFFGDSPLRALMAWGWQPNSHFERVRASGILFKRLHGVIFQFQEFPPARVLFTRKPIASLKTPPKA